MNQNSTYLVSENFYSNLNQWDEFKYITLVLKIMLSMTGSFMLYGIIWYQFHQHFMCKFFCKKHRFGSYFYIHVARKKAPETMFVQKNCKMLMKLITGMSISVLTFDTEHL
jgi:hypothetical protein